MYKLQLKGGNVFFPRDVFLFANQFVLLNAKIKKTPNVQCSLSTRKSFIGVKQHVQGLESGSRRVNVNNKRAAKKRAVFVSPSWVSYWNSGQAVVQR